MVISIEKRNFEHFFKQNDVTDNGFIQFYQLKS